jgi:nucleoside-diphosphate-sugar epimerase
MKRIVVTGGAGRLGRLVITDLLERGFDVLAVDCAPASNCPCRFQLANLAEPPVAYDVLRGTDAVLHLGAVPGPNAQPSSITFHNNVASTFHVVEAAAALGLGRVVFASSVFTLGWIEDANRYWPRYVPVDEDHPLTPFEAYGLSKQVGEAICAAASRRTGIATVSLRIMNVIQPDNTQSLPWPTPTREKPVRFVMWPYVDARDAAVACRLALEATTTGHEAFFIAARNIRFDHPTRELLRTFAPPDIEVRGPLSDRASVISIEKAERILGFDPRYEWTTRHNG